MDVCLRSVDISCHDRGPHLIGRRVNADNTRTAAIAGDAGYFLSTCECAGKHILRYLAIDGA